MTDHLSTKVGQYACIVRNGKILLLKPPKGPFWCFPGGRLENTDENAEDALRREVVEETGLAVDVAKPFHVDMWTAGAAKEPRYGVFFVCTCAKTDVRLSAEHEQHAWYTYDQAKKLFEHPDAGPGLRTIEALRKIGLL